MFPMRRLDIYLNDHLAGSTVGVELSRRAAAANHGTPAGEFLERLHGEIAEDRRVLEDIMRALGVDVSPIKPAVAWVAEKAGRVKLNGQVRGYSPLSRLLELGGLEVGISGKRSLWQVLDTSLGDDPRLAPFDLGALVDRAEAQLRDLREHRLAAASEALVSAPAASASRA